MTLMAVLGAQESDFKGVTPPISAAVPDLQVSRDSFESYSGIESTDHLIQIEITSKYNCPYSYIEHVRITVDYYSHPTLYRKQNVYNMGALDLPNISYIYQNLLGIRVGAYANRHRLGSVDQRKHRISFKNRHTVKLKPPFSTQLRVLLSD